MENRPILTPVQQDGSSEKNVLRHAACLTCRRSKTRCHRAASDAKCKRCQQAGIECVIPEYHVGRQKGVKNKQPALDKAVRRLEEAIVRSRAEDGQFQDESTALKLQELFHRSQSLFSSSRLNMMSGHPEEIQLPTQSNHSQDHTPCYGENGSNSTVFSGPSVRENSFALDDADNPLQLLARASDLPSTMHLLPGSQNQQLDTKLHSQSVEVDRGENGDLRAFFGLFSPYLDIGDDIDPVDMGLVTLNETDVLFTFFYKNLSHTRWGLDPVVHTSSFVRSRSAFLFTSILAASALFLPSTAALSKRLSTHCKRLANLTIVNRNRSPEIVLAYMINIPWMSPGKHWADDETCSYMAMALTIAVDLSLHKVVMPCSRLTPVGWENVPKSECITASKALALDGFNDVQPNSAWAQRLLRSRERIWLALFVLDRGVCLARGRRYTVPVTFLVDTCDNWHISDISDTWDGSIISTAVLRKQLPELIDNIRTACDAVIPATVQALKDMIESFFDRWYGTWAFSVQGSRQNPLPPYVEILVTHGRLSIYSAVINHPTTPPLVSRFFWTAGLSSALNVMRAAVQGESQLKSMPNNTAIMISFSACFALLLTNKNSAEGASGESSLVPSIRSLVFQTADMLERIGNAPVHRNGASALYGRHLREVVKNTALNASHTRPLLNTSNTMQTVTALFDQNRAASGIEHGEDESASVLMVFEPLQFSAMSDHQIVEAVNEAQGEVETFLLPFQMDDSTAMRSDWLDWFNLEDIL